MLRPCPPEGMHRDNLEAVRRAALPQILFVEDIGLALRLGHAATRRAILRGECGPYFRQGRRLAVLRDSFLAALAHRQESAHPSLHSVARRP